jgi:hypothetical protein
VPVDFSGACCGLLVWIGGTIWVVVAARRVRAARPTEIHPIAVIMAGGVAFVVLFFVFLAIVIGYDILTVR